MILFFLRIKDWRTFCSDKLLKCSSDLKWLFHFSAINYYNLFSCRFWHMCSIWYPYHICHIVFTKISQRRIQKINNIVTRSFEFKLKSSLLVSYRPPNNLSVDNSFPVSKSVSMTVVIPTASKQLFILYPWSMVWSCMQWFPGIDWRNSVEKWWFSPELSGSQLSTQWGFVWDVASVDIM